MIKTIIFDLDGTLINSLADLAEATNNALRISSFPIHKIENFKYIIGNGVIQQIRRSVPSEYKDDMQTVNKIINEFQNQYKLCWHNKSQPYDGIKQLLLNLNNSGYKQAVASNKPDFFTKKIVSHFFGNETFECVQGNTDTIPKKPDPTIAIQIMKNLGVNPSECVFVGDTYVDMETAHNAGIFSIGCLWGFRTRQELENAGADLIVNTPDEIFQYIISQTKGENL